MNDFTERELTRLSLLVDALVANPQSPFLVVSPIPQPIHR